MNCPKCLNDAERTDWKPPEGYDPYLVQYKCTVCSYIFYEARGKQVEHQGVKAKGFNR